MVGFPVIHSAPSARSESARGSAMTDRYAAIRIVTVAVREPPGVPLTVK